MVEAYLSGGPVMILLTMVSILALGLAIYSLQQILSMRSRPEVWRTSLRLLEEQGADPLEAMEAATYRLQSAIAWLSRLAGLSTLLGLLGTVLGISEAFADMRNLGQAGPDVFASGIYQALHTTIAGLILAVPFLVAHHLLKDSLGIRQMELQRSHPEGS